MYIVRLFAAKTLSFPVCVILRFKPLGRARRICSCRGRQADGAGATEPNPWLRFPVLLFVCLVIFPVKSVFSVTSGCLLLNKSCAPIILCAAHKGARAADEKVLASGESVLQSEGGFIYRVFPDGRKELVKQIEAPTPVTPGTRFTIR